MKGKVFPEEGERGGGRLRLSTSTWLQRLVFRLDAVTSFSTLTMMRSRLREYAETRAARRGGRAMPAWAQHAALCVVMPPLFAAWFARRWLRLVLGLAGACRKTVALVTQIALAGKLGSLAYVGALVAFRAAKGCEIPNFKGSYLGRFPLVSADLSTSDHLSERFRT